MHQQLGQAHIAAQVDQMLAALDGNQAQQPDDVEAMLAQLPPEQRAEMEAQLRQLQAQLAAMSPEERARMETQARLSQAVQQARGAAERQLWPAAVTYQQDAVALARQLVDQAPEAEQRDVQIQLSVLLYNLAGYYTNANRHAVAVTCLEEVVAIDAATGNEDLADDRRALEAARQRAAAAETHTAPPPDIAALLASVPAAQRAQVEEALAQFSDELAQMGPEERDQLLQGIANFAALSPEEQAALAEQSAFTQIEAHLLGQLAPPISDHAAGTLTGEQAAAVAQNIDDVADQVAQDERLGNQRHDLVALLRHAAAVLRGDDPAPPLPAAYAEQWADWMG